MQFKAFIPILNPLVILANEKKEEDFIRNTFKQMIYELNDEKEYSFYIGEELVNGKICIEEKSRKELEEKYKIKNTFRLKYCLCILIELDVNRFEDNYFESELIKKYSYTKEQIVSIRVSNIVEEFKKTINDLRIAINIAFPGFFDTHGGYIYVENEEYDDLETSISGSLLGAILNAREKQWPKVEILTIKQTWNWILKRKDFINAMGSKPIERALSAFTHIFDANNYEDLFYSLIGIEAIYTSGRQGVLEQLREKSIAIFGEPENYKNSLSKMYDIRSRFMHGTLNFPSKYYIYDGIEEFDEFMRKEYSQCLEMAEALLVATIQQFVINDAEDLNYHLQIEFR